ncbi:hypothetical protein BGW41_005646 [Actinomortierella wolfii]|nr:hypothetical protein BGW41_005646 [Actinomortierella wolfii]
MAWDPMEPALPGCGMTPWVGSFDPVKFIYFILATVLLPYPCYVILATVFNWEHDRKRPSEYYQDVLNAISYGLILFIFGNYTQTFNWITILAFWITWPAYSLIAELPFAKTSLPRWRSWPKGMYILFLGALGVILAFAAYHIYLGYQLNKTVPGFLGYYLLGLLIPVALTLIGYACYKQQNSDFLKLSRVYNQLLYWQWKRAARVAKAKVEKQQKAEAAAAAKAQKAAAAAAAIQTPPTPPPKTPPQQPLTTLEDQLNAAADAADAAVAAGASSVVVQVSDEPPTTAPSARTSQDGLVLQPTTSTQVHVEVNPNVPTSTVVGSSAVPASHQAETSAGAIDAAGVSGPQDPQVEPAAEHPELTVSIQPYVPFDHWVSQVGGGIVIGCYMQGVMAYGHDHLLEE